ncbi:hypothetical protein ACFLWO_02185 [Chloroflexota bacterium]
MMLKLDAKETAAIAYPQPVSLEVTTNDLDEMIDQAGMFASWVPCYGVINQLEKEGIKVNATAGLSLGLGDTGSQGWRHLHQYLHR